MKHNFLKSILALLLVGVTLTYVGCKDYDDDIGNVSTELTETATALQEQLNTLQTALQNVQADATAAAKAAADAQAAADAAQKAGDDAAAAAADAAKAAAAAQQAVAQAKAEAIQEAIAQCKALLAGKADQKALDDLRTKVEGIEKQLGDALKGVATVSEVNKLKEALEIQQKALEKYKELLDDKASKDDLDALEARLQKLIEDAQSGAMDEEALKAAVKELSDDIMETVNGKLSSLAGVLSSRLTSVTLVPSLYVDGIPTIEFQSIKYWAKKIGQNGAVVPASDSTIVSDESTTADYRLNPTGVGEDDITMPSFVSTTAVTRAATGENTPVKVVGYEINNGIMTVTAAKTTTESLEKQAGNKIYTVALKVPVAEAELFEGEEEAFVYSEYVRLDEQTITPVIAARIDQNEKVTKYGCASAHHHFYTYAQVYAQDSVGKMISNRLKYDEPYDLSQMVTACYEADGAAHEMTAEKLADYGLAFRFEVAPDPFKVEPNDTDQQQFAAIDGSVISSKVPGGYTNNAAAVDKEPIVRVTLVDTVNNKIADVKYFKIKWTKTVASPDPIDLGEVKVFDAAALSCDTIENAFLWKDMTEFVYAVMKDQTGMSKAEFESIYTLKANADGTFGKGDGEIVETPSSSDEDAVALTWVLSPEAVGTIVPAASKDYTIEVTYTDPNGVYGDVTFSFKTTVNVTLPDINGYYEQYWLTKGELANVYPVQYNTPAALDTCVYNYDLMQLFTPGQFFIKGLLPCGSWDLQFGKTQPVAGYAPAMTVEPAGNNDTKGYSLLKGLEKASTLTFSDPVATNWYGAANTTNRASISLEKNAAGKGLVDKNATLKVWADINGYNKVAVAAFNVHFVAPLKINAELQDGEFFDHVISGSHIDCSKAFTMTDFNNYIVAETTTNTTEEKAKYAAELWDYYQVDSVKWDTEAAKIGMKRSGGDVVVDDELTATSPATMKLSDVYAGASVEVVGSDLVFTNNSAGAGVEKACNIFIPVTVEYGWGEVSQWVKIRLNPGK
ncbi:hypothetical protein [uncultured Alistipes sp.]|uniref:hypothetical protein n=1 Tax=uncultured Alistipes sp. TaxID=538949 RepID=UPI00261F7125|nr:hypothetical protein [uncultured Alistipes sp.]